VAKITKENVMLTKHNFNGKHNGTASIKHQRLIEKDILENVE